MDRKRGVGHAASPAVLRTDGATPGDPEHLGQSGRIAREGIDPGLSTLADRIGHAGVVLAPIQEPIARRVLAGASLHGDDTAVPLPARGGTGTARLGTCARDGEPLRRRWVKPDGERRSTAARHPPPCSRSRATAG